MGLTFVIAPTVGTVLYSAWPPLPIIVGAITMAIVTAFVLLHPRFRRIPSGPTPTAPGGVVPDVAPTVQDAGTQAGPQAASTSEDSAGHERGTP